MRIAIWHNLPSGGGKRALYDHVRGLLARGHIVEAWCPPTADQTYLPLNEFIPEHVLPFEWKPVVTKTLMSRLTSEYRNKTRKIKAMDEHCNECAKEINHGGFDLLFANSCMYFRTTSIGQYVDIPKILYLQEPYRPLYEATPQLPWKAIPNPKNSWLNPRYIISFLNNLIDIQSLRIQVREEIENARFYNTILVNSLFSRENILRAYGLDAKVCYLGVDTDMFFDKNLPKENIVVGIGAFDGNKNIEFVIRSLSLVPEPRPKLVWIGDRGNDSMIDPLIQISKSSGVSFEPRVKASDNELVNILNRAKLMTYAPRLEPFGYAPLEANACRLPVVAVAEGGVRETVIDGVNGLLVENTHQAMADGIQRLLIDNKYAQALGNNGHKLVEQKWSVTASVDRLEKRFIEVLESLSRN